MFSARAVGLYGVAKVGHLQWTDGACPHPVDEQVAYYREQPRGYARRGAVTTTDDGTSLLRPECRSPAATTRGR